MTLEIKADMRELTALAESMGKSASQISTHVVSAVNTVAKAANETSRRMMIAQVKFSKDRLDSKMTFDLATEGMPTATITANGRGTILTNFGAKYVEKPASSRSKTRSTKGGVSVAIKPAGTIGVIERGFFLKLKHDNGDGVFTRDRSGELKHRYGPSPDQVFKGVSAEIAPQVEIDLRNEILSELDKITVTI